MPKSFLQAQRGHRCAFIGYETLTRQSWVSVCFFHNMNNEKAEAVVGCLKIAYKSFIHRSSGQKVLSRYSKCVPRYSKAWQRPFLVVIWKLTVKGNKKENANHAITLGRRCHGLWCCTTCMWRYLVSFGEVVRRVSYGGSLATLCRD